MFAPVMLRGELRVVGADAQISPDFYRMSPVERVQIWNPRLRGFGGNGGGTVLVFRGFRGGFGGR